MREQLPKIGFFLAALMAAWAVFPSLGYLSALERHVERAVRSFEADGSPTVRFAWSAGHNVLWAKEGREFWHDGQLYDVKKIERSADSLIVIAWPDGREMQLHDFFSMKKTSDESHWSLIGWAAWFGSPFDCFLNEFRLKAFDFRSNSTFFIEKTASSRPLEIVAPPPDRAFGI